MKIDWKIIVETFVGSLVLVFCLGLIVLSYYMGYENGKMESAIATSLESNNENNGENASSVTYYIQLTPKPVQTINKPKLDWTGPQLWEEVNKARVENGVGVLGQRDELCTIASIRLNELLVLGTLDNHEGFSTLPDRRDDLKWIYEKYNISEFLVYGATSAKDAVDLWFNTLGHKKILTGGEYVYGCTYAQNGFGVGIAAY